VSLLLASAAGCAGREVAAPPGPALTPLEQLQNDLATITRRPGVQHGVWGVAVHSIDRSERLFELNARTLLVPASAAKLVTAASAVDAVGWDHRFETAMSVSGPLIDVTGGSAGGRLLGGDVLITGTGDPSIGGRGGTDLSAFVDAIAARGITQITGRIIGDDDAVEEPRPALAWAWDDLGYRTGAIFGALNFAENRLTVSIAPAAASGAAATVTPDSPAARPLLSRVETGPPGSPVMVWPEQRPGEPFLTIAGSVPIGAEPVRLQVSAGNPTQWFAAALEAQLEAAGIVVHGKAADIDDLEGPLARESFRLVHLHASPPLADLVSPLLKESINMYGEALLRLNVPQGTFPTNDAALEGLQTRMTRWGIPSSAYQLVDGSGLSRRNVIAPDALIAVLTRMHDPSAMSPWMLALPLAGVDGSLAARMKGTPAEGTVRAKTGTMSNVRALAGYAITRDGEHLAFAAIVNNFEGTGAQANDALDTIAARLAGFSRSMGDQVP
jgi:D-alanyl-D-alanine carboxypeptidase/D-alanyl-D-alanine-endopeptidase (penicillin-binding protein 4)